MVRDKNTTLCGLTPDNADVFNFITPSWELAEDYSNCKTCVRVINRVKVNAWYKLLFAFKED